MSLVRDIQDWPPAREVDGRTVLPPAPEPTTTEPGPAEPEVLAPFDAPITVRAAPSYAQLLVQRIDDEHFVLQGQHRNDAVAEPIGEKRGRPRLALAELASSRRAGGADFTPENLYQLMLVWSQDEPELIDWLQQVRATVGDQELHLVIWDTTGFEIPWEMLKLPGREDPPLRSGLLGALFAVSRRVTGGQATGECTRYTDHACRGRLLAYVDDEMAADREFLPGYATGAANNLGQLLGQLQQAQGLLGLVYVACHGEYADELTELLLDGVRYSAILTASLPALIRSRAVVFLNACHAARLLWDPRLNSGVHGFARAFVHGGADVVIGPTGLVENKLAGRVASGILGQVTREPSLSLAAALTQVRADIAQRMDEWSPAKEDLKELVYTFMYVCYGNPYATLELTDSE